MIPSSREWEKFCVKKIIAGRAPLQEQKREEASSEPAVTVGAKVLRFTARRAILMHFMCFAIPSR